MINENYRSSAGHEAFQYEPSNPNNLGMLKYFPDSCLQLVDLNAEVSVLLDFKIEEHP